APPLSPFWGSSASRMRRKAAGIETRAFLSTDWWISPLNASAICPVASAKIRCCPRANENGRIGLLPLSDPPLSHRWASSYARHLGEMSARSRAGSLSSDERGCLYEAALFALFGVFRRPCVLFARLVVREKGMTWDSMG